VWCSQGGGFDPWSAIQVRSRIRSHVPHPRMKGKTCRFSPALPTTYSWSHLLGCLFTNFLLSSSTSYLLPQQVPFIHLFPFDPEIILYAQVLVRVAVASTQMQAQPLNPEHHQSCIRSCSTFINYSMGTCF
jgi:hypothetical protein